MTDKISTQVNFVTWAGAAISGVGALSVTDWLAVGGFLLALAGFSLNWWHKRQMVKIARAELELKRLQADQK